jgi:uncharacterized protein YecE (DUF72 family)
MPDARAYLGTSGWNYRHWREVFYPKGVAQRKWLSYFAGEFDTVEVNNTFYRVPKAHMVSGWSEAVPQRFRFAVKLWRGITHQKKLKDCREQLDRFFEAAAVLPTPQRGPVLVQLPPSQNKDTQKLAAFLEDLKAATGRERWKIVVEFRHTGWLCPETYEVLDRARAAICLQDMPPADVTLPNNARFVYVRRHGPGGDYRGAYSDEQLDGDAQAIGGWLAEGRSVFVYFNNDEAGNAVIDARRLRERLRP